MKDIKTPLDLDLTTFDSDFRLKPNEVLFQDDPDWSQNALLRDKGWSSYVYGYKQAADLLAQRFLEDCQSMDVIAFPMVFLYHHYIELQLKELIAAGQGFLGQPVDFPENKHTLLPLWLRCRQILAEVWPNESDSTWKNVEKLIKEFDKHDPDGLGFRYAYGKKKSGRSPAVPHLRTFSVRNFYEVMQHLAKFFEAHLAGIDVDRRNISGVD